MMNNTFVHRLVGLLSASSPPPEHDEYWLPCRETEGRAINTFLRACLSTTDTPSASSSSSKKSNSSNPTKSNKRALYIAGKPGTGKTASVNRIMSRLALEMKQPGISSGPKQKYHTHRIINVNAASLLGSSKSNIFLEIARQMGLNTTEKGFDPIKQLESKFLPKRKPSKRTKMTIIMIDEIDALLSEQMTGGGANRSGSAKFQDALYRLFEWPLRKNSTLILVAIANRIDLLSRYLPLLARNNVEPQRIIFGPYDHDVSFCFFRFFESKKKKKLYKKNSCQCFDHLSISSLVGSIGSHLSIFFSFFCHNIYIFFPLGCLNYSSSTFDCCRRSRIGCYLYSVGFRKSSKNNST